MTQRFVITGAPGSGKTPLLTELAAAGFATVPEPAREVITEQRAIDPVPIYDRNSKLFLELMLEHAIAHFDGAEGTTFFDRGIPDLIGYAGLFGLDDAEARGAADGRRYESTVFVLPSWPEIYTTDTDRRMTFEHARTFGERVRGIYADLGYTLVDVPKTDVRSRAAFVVDVLEGTG